MASSNETHAGFSSSATGTANAKLKTKTDKLIETLLAQKQSARHTSASLKAVND
jgi:hypothetical protein